MNYIKICIIVFLSIITCFSDLFAQEKQPYEVTARSHKAAPMAKRSDFAQRFPYIPMNGWKEGIRFIVAPVRSPEEPQILPLVAYKSGKDPLTEGVLRKDYELRVLVFEGFEQGTYQGENFIYAVFDLNGLNFEYRFVGTEAMFEEDQGPTYLEGLIVLDEIEFVKQSLLGKDLYVLKRTRLKEDENGKVSTSAGLKFDQVTVKDIGVGSINRPIRIVYTDSYDNEAYFDVCLTGVNVESKGWKNHFDQFFSFKNPRNNYPDIRDHHWEKIQKGQLAIGMTQQECELSWGAALDVTRVTEEGLIKETWTYPGYVLEFENKRLKRAIKL